MLSSWLNNNPSLLRIPITVFHSLYPATLAIHPASGAGPDHPVVPCRLLKTRIIKRMATPLTIDEGAADELGDKVLGCCVASGIAS